MELLKQNLLIPKLVWGSIPVVTIIISQMTTHLFFLILYFVLDVTLKSNW